MYPYNKDYSEVATYMDRLANALRRKVLVDGQQIPLPVIKQWLAEQPDSNKFTLVELTVKLIKEASSGKPFRSRYKGR